MNWSWTLYRYLGRQFLYGVLTVFCAFLVLAFSIDVVDLLNRTAGRSLDSLTVIGMALLHLPDLGQKLLPFAVLLGGVLSFVMMSRHQELVASRAAGFSAWDFLLPPLIVAILLGVFHVAAVTPVASRMLAHFSALEAKYIKGQDSQLSLGSNGLWLRQGDETGQSVIHALRVSNQGAHLENVIVFLYGTKDSYLGRVDARSADLTEGAWMMRGAFVSGSDGAVARYDRYVLRTTLTKSRILESFAPPDTLSFWALPAFIASAQNAGFTTVRYRLYLYNLLTLPLMFAAMVFMAASFSLNVSRSGGLGRVVLLGALSGFAVYFFGDLTTALGRSSILPAGLAATAPALAAILIGMTLVFHREDG
jgi:lipopolysaccharide export system permease protein